MADWAGIRAAIAAQAATAAGIREATSTKLSVIGMLPSVKVERVSSLQINDERGGRGAGFEARIARVEGKLLVSMASDVGRAQTDAEGLVELLFAAARTGIKLGMATIVEDSWLERATLGPQEFGDQQLYGADLEWVVKTFESVERTS